MSDKDNKDNQELDDLEAYEAELKAEAEAEKAEKNNKTVKAVPSRYPDKDKAKAAEKEKKKGKKEFFLKRFGKWIARKTRDLISELKKVSWPAFPKVLKQTGIVISVVLFFLVVVFAIDFTLSLGYNEFIKAITSGTDTGTEVIKAVVSGIGG